jgi:anti-sigma regulatory factor (Ser/Thr protein kinase)
MTMHAEFERHINSLEQIYGFIKTFMKKEQLHKDLESPLNLVIEELFTNMLKYNPGNMNKIHVDLKKEGDQILMILTEYDVEPFDIRTATEYNATQNLNERPNGKIGLHLVKKYVDDIQYDYSERVGKIGLIINLRKNHV